MGFECRKNCSTVFTQSSNRIRHENERCVIFGGEIDKRSLNSMKLVNSLKRSMVLSYTLLRYSKS